jgi:hypothetical protein
MKFGGKNRHLRQAANRYFDKIILEKYMTRFLQNRNQILKEILEK